VKKCRNKQKSEARNEQDKKYFKNCENYVIIVFPFILTKAILPMQRKITFKAIK